MTSNGVWALRNARISKFARVAELVDALASGASIRKDVGVQVPPRAQYVSARWMKICANRKGPRETGGLSSFLVVNEALTPRSRSHRIHLFWFSMASMSVVLLLHRASLRWKHTAAARGSIVQHPPPVDHLRGPL